MSANKFYLTTPIYYVNARPHIGHAYTTIVADVLARRHRLLGDDTFFLTGTDEHGQKIERSAAAAGIPPQQFADQVSKTFSDLWQRMGITNNAYIRTTDAAHAKGVQKLFATLYEKGFIYLASYTGAYCVSDEAFIDAPIGTPCPDCGRLLEEVTEENFFFKLSEFQKPLLALILAKDLAITPSSARNEIVSFLAGNVEQAVANNITTSNANEPANVDFDAVLKAFEAGVVDYVEADGPEGYLKAYYVPGALKDLSISRSSFTWGIPVPEPAASTAKQPHVIYVWLDALANYMTALGYGSDDTTLFDKFWPADLHLVGKEITRFHCVYWPAFLLAAGLPLPKQITAHGWLLFDNSKMSKSKGNIVRTETILDAFGPLCPPPPTPPQDIVILSEAKDLLSADQPTPSAEATNQVPQGFSLGSPSKEKEEGALAPGTALKGTGFSPSVEAPKSDAALAAEGTPAESAQTDRDLFAADVLRYFLLREIPFGQDGTFSFEALITRYNADLANGYGNLVSRTLSMIEKYFDGIIPFGVMDERVGLAIKLHVAATTNNFAECDFSSLLQNVASIVREADTYITSTAPWKLAADPERREELTNVLYTAAESIRIVTSIIEPVLPFTASRVFTELGIPTERRPGTEPRWTGTHLGPLGPIFPRADKGLAQIMSDLENPTPASEPASTDPAAPPRTASLDEPTGTLTVAGSTATTTGSDGTPSHTEIAGSGIFAQPAQTPLTTDNLEPTTPQITIDDFAKIDLRVAQITLAERIPKADKLLRLEVDLGPLGTRQILSGIAEFYTPEELTGRRIVVITNLAPRKMRGLESHGMLLAASSPDKDGGDHGKPALATCGDDIPLGARLK